MSERRLNQEDFDEITNATLVSIRRACVELGAVCDAAEGIDPMIPRLGDGAGLHVRAATLRSQAAAAFAASATLNAAAATYETLGLVVDQSRAVLPISLPPLAKAKKSAKSRKP